MVNFSWNENEVIIMMSLLEYTNKKLKPNLLFSFSWPHIITDYGLYLMCKHVYDIPVLFVDVILFNTNKR